MFELYIFDLDGTLLDTFDDLTIAVNYALERSGLPLRTKEEVRSFVGNGVVRLIERAIGEGEADVSSVLADYKNYYSDHSAVMTKPYEGIVELLQELKSRGKKIAIVSNKHDAGTRFLAKAYFDGLIDFVLGENELAGICRKPAPDAVNLALETLGVKKEFAVYVGDMEVDIQTARNAQISCISVVWGLRNEKFLREKGGDIFVKEPKEILEI